VLVAPENRGRINLKWLLRKLGKDGVSSILVEGGGEVNASFLFGGLAHRVVFFYAPKVLGDRNGIKAVAGQGARRAGDLLKILHPEYRRFGGDLFMTGLVSL
jgi:diaminohydroxyphosphoribosylaminopyrimidine deaminase/5-amino-6-(5-phosphoribosylamino)uracil reductase